MINIKFWTLKILAQITLLIPMGEILKRKDVISLSFFVDNCHVTNSLILPHDAVNHFHNNFVNCVKEVDDNFALFAQGPQDGAKGQAEEYDAKSVGSRPAT